MLQQDHIAPLTAYAARLRQMGLGQVPDFDPLDGGIEARVLFLFKKPGQMAAEGSGKRLGSGFISRNNDDETAEATFNFMNQAGLPRKATITWNVVPWWNDKKFTAQERFLGIQQLKELCDLLPHLKVVVLVGKDAQHSRSYFEKLPTAPQIICSFLPTRQNKNMNSEGWNAIPKEWAKAKRALWSTERC